MERGLYQIASHAKTFRQIRKHTDVGYVGRTVSIIRPTRIWASWLGGLPIGHLSNRNCFAHSAGHNLAKRLQTLARAEQIVGRERRERELIADFQLPIVDLIRAAACLPPVSARVIRME